ncbi:MAG: DUF2442 domain-containing protein [Actinomycetota bacterium]
MDALPLVAAADYRGGYRIHLTFHDGTEGTVDLEDWLKGPVFEPIRDQSFFRRFCIEGGTLARPNGVDLAPETLHEAARSSAAA